MMPSVECAQTVVSDPKMSPCDVMAQGLCLRCGACAALCSHRIVSMDSSSYPTPQDCKASSGCTAQCLKACPGTGVDLRGLHARLRGTKDGDGDPDRDVQEALLVHASDEAVRSRGSSGGAVTQLLLSLMRTGVISSALVAGMSEEEPWKGRSVLARTPQDIEVCAGSKYTVIPLMERLRDIMRSKEPAAIVGLPCHVQAFRMLQTSSPEEVSNVKLVIGLFCNVNIEMEGTRRMLECAGIDEGDVDRIEYRYGSWPGKMVAFLKDKTMRPLHGVSFKTGAFNYLRYLYVPRRCLSCPDYSSELADLSVGDPWSRNKDEETPRVLGTSLMLVRTPVGRAALEHAISQGDLCADVRHCSNGRSAMETMIRKKRLRSQFEIQTLSKRGLPKPDYHLAPLQPSALETTEERIDQALSSLGRYDLTRRLASRMAFSPVGSMAAHLLGWRKNLIARFHQ